MKLKTQSSEINIEDVNPTTIFLVYDFESEKFAFERCEQNKAEGVSSKGVTLEFNKGSSAENTVLIDVSKTTEFLTFRPTEVEPASKSALDYKWMKAKDIKVGDRCLRHKTNAGSARLESYPVLSVTAMIEPKDFYKVKSKSPLVGDNFIIRF